MALPSSEGLTRAAASTSKLTHVAVGQSSSSLPGGPLHRATYGTAAGLPRVGKEQLPRLSQPNLESDMPSLASVEVIRRLTLMHTETNPSIVWEGTKQR